MATITGTEMIVRNGKALVTPPTISAQGNRVLVTDSNGAIIGSDVSRQRLSDLGNAFSVVNGKVCITYDDGQ